MLEIPFAPPAIEPSTAFTARSAAAKSSGTGTTELAQWPFRSRNVSCAAPVPVGPIDIARQQWLAGPGIEQPEFQAARTAIDRQNAHAWVESRADAAHAAARRPLNKPLAKTKSID